MFDSPKIKTTTLTEAHNQWANRPADQRFETLEALTAAVKNRRMRSRAQEGTIAAIHLEGTEDGDIFVNGQTTRSKPSHWAFGQLATTLGAPAGYLRKLPAPLAVDCLRNGIKNAEDGAALKFLSLAPDDDVDHRTLQAVTSTSYGRIWDADVADLAGRIVEQTGGRFHNPLAYNVPGKLGGEASPSGLYASDRDVFIFMIDGGSLLEPGPRAELHRGFFLKNSEVGSAAFSLTTFLFNVVCGNHLVWGARDVNEFSVRHSKNGPYRFDSEAMPRLLEYANASAAPIESAIKRAIDYSIRTAGLGFDSLDSTKLTLEHFQTFAAKGAKFTRLEVREAVATAEREEGKCETLWDFVQGLTAYARGFEWIDARADLEARAGKLMDLVKGE